MKYESENPGALAGATGGPYSAQSGQAAQSSGGTNTDAPHTDIALMRDFLSQLTHRASARGMLELAWTDTTGGALNRAHLFALDETDELVAHAARENAHGANVYVGGGLRCERAAGAKRANKSDIIASLACWADFDGEGDLQCALACMGTLGLTPNFVIITGRHPYERGQVWFFLEEPSDDLAGIEVVNAALAARFKGDRSVKNRDRVMRLPGSLAWPKKPGRVLERTLKHAADMRAAPYTIEELRRKLGCDDETVRKRTNGHANGETHVDDDFSDEATEAEARLHAWVDAAIADEVGKVLAASEGERNDTLNRAAFALGQIVGAGLLTRQRAEETLTAAAADCGLPVDEAAATIKSGLGAGEKQPRGPKKVADDAPPRGFSIRTDGVYRQIEDKEGNTRWAWLCSPIRVLSLSRDRAGEGWGRYVEIADPDGRLHYWAIPAALFAGDGTDLRRELLSLGLTISTAAGSRAALSDLLQRWTPKVRALTTNRLGWADETCKAFVLGNSRVLGSEGVVFQSEHAPAAASVMRAAGTLETWRESVAALCIGNPLMIFAVSTAFAGPLLEPLAQESGGVHFRGQSSKGKTALLGGAVSVWGAPGLLQSWRATVNGLEGIAATCNATVLCLDELGQIDGREAGQAAYTLANGQAKGRANRVGGARARARWKVLFLSSGEISLADAMAEAGRRTKAGQEVRLLDIAADTRAWGAFDCLHGHAHGAAFRDVFVAALASHHGNAGPAFVEHLLEDVAGYAEQARQAVAAFRSLAMQRALNGKDAADGQVERAAARLGLVAAAGELATNFGITGWPPGAARDAALAVFDLWVSGRGGIGAAEARDAIDRVRAFISAHGQSRFEDIIPSSSLEVKGPPIRDRAGWRAGGRYYFTVDTWREIHRGADPQRAARHLRDAGLLAPDKDRTHLTMKVNTDGRPRCYCVLASILGFDGTDGADADEIDNTTAQGAR